MTIIPDAFRHVLCVVERWVDHKWQMIDVVDECGLKRWQKKFLEVEMREWQVVPQCQQGGVGGEVDGCSVMSCDNHLPIIHCPITVVFMESQWCF